MRKSLDDIIYVAGHRGMAGSAIVRHLQTLGYRNIITRSHTGLDLTNQAAVNAFFAQQPIHQIYLAAAKVGGIYANDTYPAAFIYQNLMIEANVIHAAHANNIKNILFLGSSCIYPRLAKQPMQEEALLTGTLEPTNEPYAIAKIAGIKLCESYNRQYGRDYRSIMPTNLYGPGDNYHPENSHVIPALIRRFHEAKISQLPQVTVWGSGHARREFLHVDDMAAAAVHVMELEHEKWQKHTQPTCSHINVGNNVDITIIELAQLIASIVDYAGQIIFDNNKPDGAPRKWMNSSILNQLGWRAQYNLEDGLADAYRWFLANHSLGI